MANPLIDQLKTAKELYKEMERVDELLAALNRGLLVRDQNVFGIAAHYINLFSEDLLTVAEHAKEVQQSRVQANKYKETFEVQPGAASGKSICKLTSQARAIRSRVKEISSSQIGNQVQSKPAL